MSTDELRPIRHKLNQLPEPDRTIVEEMIYQFLEIENCGPLSALDLFIKVSRYVLKEKRAARLGPPAVCAAPGRTKKRQNQK